MPVDVGARVLSNTPLSPGYNVLALEAPEIGAITSPGQFVMVRGAEWGDAPLLPRPMSYLTAGTTPSILIKVAGEGTIQGTGERLRRR